MSVISSRSTSIASILKGPGVRSKILGQQNRVNFKLPKNLKHLLANYDTGTERKVYEDLICILRNANIKDNELIELLIEVRQSISLLGPSHKIFIEALLSINWTNRCEEATIAYKAFLEDLVCVHIYHCKLVLDKLVSQFKPSSDDAKEWENGEPRQEEIKPLDHIHDVLLKFLNIVPMSCTLLLQSLAARYPYFKTSTHSHEIYFYSLLRILDYAPQLRSEILSLMINRLIILDVNAPRSEIENYRDSEMDEDENDAVFQIESINDTDDKQREYNNSSIDHPLAHTLDVCMKMIFQYVYNVCHPDNALNMEAVKKLYLELLSIFEKVILPTYASHHVQFIMFYICSFKVSLLDAFLKWLWHKVSNPNVAPVIRQSSVAYIASLVARANFIPISLIIWILTQMSKWAHSYISAQDSLECANSDVRVHTVFYSVCQAIFYVVAFRHKDLDTKKNLLILESLKFTTIVTCRLNPLKVCLPVVVHRFASVTRAYQIAYCYPVIEHNSRSNLPVLQSSNRFTTWLDSFFPFDPYLLRQSASRISNLYLQYQDSVNVDMPTSIDKKEDNDEDDYMDVSYSRNYDTQNYHMDKFSYSTSPGFIH